MADRIRVGVAAAEPLPVVEIGRSTNYRPRLNREAAAAAAADPPAARAEEPMPDVNGGDDAVAMNGRNEDSEEEAIEHRGSSDASRGLNNGVVPAAAAAANDQSLEQQQARPASLSDSETARKRAAAADGTDRTAKRARRLSWEERIEQLKAYKEEHGDCRVPQRYPPNRSLGTWVDNQRKAYRNFEKSGTSAAAAGSRHRISEDQIAQLEALGFVWQVQDSSIKVPWADRINQLKAYKAKHGDCRVPRKYPPDPSFGTWVKNQREGYRNFEKARKSGTSVAAGANRISKDRIAQLDEIGFVWSASRAVPWHERLDQLKDYKDKPKRPLTAYNIFFKHEREKIVTDAPDKPVTLESLKVDSTRKEKKRLHRKTHGKIGFADLARTIAGEWKTLDPKTRAVFDSCAAKEKERYKTELKEWKAFKKSLSCRRTRSCPENGAGSC